MSAQDEKTEFERFFAEGEWDKLLNETTIPQDQMRQPQEGPVSWDRRAAWLVYSEMRSRGKAGPTQPDLFA